MTGLSTQLVRNREAYERLEDATLAPYAVHSAQSRGRPHPERGDPALLRTCFQRDLGRIIHSFAFRRLQLKTQVFVTHEGDFYRTRLTHTQAVAQLAGSIARSLGLSEDLTEAIALAHDLGHPPFGHGGELELEELMKDHGGFEHNLQALRVVDDIEPHSPGFRGLNLTFETREGLAHHRTEYDQPVLPEEFGDFPSPSLEAQVVNAADGISFRSHDLEDALWLGLIDEQDLNGAGLALWERCRERARAKMSEQGESGKTLRRLTVKELINTLIEDLVEHTSRRLEEESICALEEVRRCPQPLAAISLELQAESRQLGDYLYERVYQHPTVVKMIWKGRNIIRRLFEAYRDEPRMLPRDLQARTGELPLERIICDYLAGMTDRYAMDQYIILSEPYARAGIDPTAVE